MYEFESRVRYSETGADGALTLSGIVSYFQDCTIFHSESIGLGMDYLGQRNQAWLLSAWQIVIDKYPKLGDRLKIATWPYGMKGFYGYRNFSLRGEHGEVYAYAASTWIFVDTKTGKPIRMTEEQKAGYPAEEAYPMKYEGRKIILPDTLSYKGKVAVHKSQIDTNQHVNNNEYIKMALESLPQDRKVHQLRADYKKAAVMGDEIYIATGEREDWSVVSLCNDKNEPYANVEFLFDTL